MELDRLSPGEKTAAVSAVLLLVFMFFDWFGLKVSSDVPNLSGTPLGENPDWGSAWETMTVTPILLMVAIVAALGVAVVRLTDADLEPTVSLNAIVAALGGLAVLLVLYRIVSPPAYGAIGGVELLDTTRKLGIFLSLVAAGGIAYGGYSAMREEGMTFADAADRLSAGGGDKLPPAGPPPPPPPPPGR